MIGGDEPARLLDLRLLLRLQDRAIRARDRDRVLRQGCAGQGDDNRQRTRAAELDFRSEANHAVSNHETQLATVPTVKQEHPPAAASRNKLFFSLAPSLYLSRRSLGEGGTGSARRQPDRPAFLSTINSVKERGSHGALRSQLSTAASDRPR